MLHITNGESVTGTFRQVRFPGTYLAWNDVLHDGPVPQTATLNELSDVRAQALAGFGWGDPEKMRADFASRDRTLQDFRKHQDVVLWFEHDLYDQLQLIQLLDWFEQQDLEGINLDLVQIDSYPGVRPVLWTRTAQRAATGAAVSHAQTCNARATQHCHGSMARLSR